MSILNLPLERPVTTVMLLVGIVLLGIISWSKLPQSLYPSVTYPQISVVTKYTQAGPEEIEKLITKQIEEAVSVVKGLKKITSISKEGVSIVICEFDWGTNIDFAALEVRQKIDLIKVALPRESEEPIVLKYNPFQHESMVVSINYIKDKPLWDYVKLTEFCKKTVKVELERIDGVAKVDLRGSIEKEIAVEVDNSKLLANNLSLIDIIKIIRESNISYPAGTIKKDISEYLVKTDGEFKKVDDISNLLLFPVSSEHPYEEEYPAKRSVRYRKPPERQRKFVYLKDVATVEEKIKELEGYSRYNLKQNISLYIYPQSGANLVKISKDIRKKLKSLEPKLPPETEIKIIYDAAEYIKSSLNSIYTAGILGGVLAFLILYFFLRNFSVASIVCISIPICVISTFIMMYLGGLSINLMSLGGLALGVGMVIDSSIVVLESIYTEMQRNTNKPKKEVIYTATEKVLSDIISSTLTTVVIFLPLIFVAGIIGQLFKELALTITFSLLSSIFVSIILIPRFALSTEFNVVEKQFKIISYLNYYFPKLLKKFFSLPNKVIFTFLVLYISTGILFLIAIKKEFVPKSDERRFFVNISFSPDTSLEMTNDIISKIEKYISTQPEVKDIITTVGRAGREEFEEKGVETLETYQGKITVNLKPAGRSTSKIIAEINKFIKTLNIDELETEFIDQQGLFGLGIGATAGITVEIRGTDLDLLQKKSSILGEKLSTYPEVYGIKIIPPEKVPEIKFEIDREKASLLGFSSQDIAATTLSAIKGYEATKFKQQEDEYSVTVRLSEKDRKSIYQVGNTILTSYLGKSVLLSQIATIKNTLSLPEIRRIDRERVYILSATVKKGFGKILKKTKQIINELKEKDVDFVLTGETLMLRESMRSLIFTLILSVILIYMIIASQFESLILPLITIGSIPVSFIGAIITLFFCFQSLNSLSMLGLIMLSGIIVNNGIILVDIMNKEIKKSSKENLLEIIIRCVSERLRPILMTVLTTIFGLLPLALGFGQGPGMASSMAIGVIGGLIFGLVLTLFLVPWIYYSVVKMGK